MVTVRIKGGLGNQLFQYAAGYALAQRLQQPMQMDISFFPKQTLRGFKLLELAIKNRQTIGRCNFPISIYKNKFLNKLLRNVNARTLSCGKYGAFLLETRSDIVSEYFTIQKDNIYLDGYYQSEKYFKEYREQLIAQFTPQYNATEEYKRISHEIRKCNSVAVHVRRGDFLQAQNDPNPNHYLLSDRYYHNALDFIAKEVGNAVYFWFSDDIDWVKHNFGERTNFRYVCLDTPYADIDEMMLMKQCHHIIAANSTFSWWASWLNESEKAIHLCPAKRYGNLHMIPDNWVKVEV